MQALKWHGSDRSDLQLVPPAPVRRGGNAQGLPIFRDRAPGDLDPVCFQFLGNCLIREHIGWTLGLDQLPDSVTNGFGRMLALSRSGAEEELHRVGAALGS